MLSWMNWPEYWRLGASAQRPHDQAFRCGITVSRTHCGITVFRSLNHPQTFISVSMLTNGLPFFFSSLSLSPFHSSLSPFSLNKRFIAFQPADDTNLFENPHEHSSIYRCHTNIIIFSLLSLYDFVCEMISPSVTA